MARKISDKKKNKRSNNAQYIGAVVAMMAFGIIGSVLITALRPQEDNIVVIAAMLGFLAPTTFSILAFMKAQETHLSVNSRLDGFIENAERAAGAEGRMQGQKEGRASVSTQLEESEK